MVTDRCSLVSDTDVSDSTQIPITIVHLTMRCPALREGPPWPANSAEAGSSSVTDFDLHVIIVIREAYRAPMYRSLVSNDNGISHAEPAAKQF